MSQTFPVVIYDSSGYGVRSDMTIELSGGRIKFLASPFALKDEIKAMKGARWHGFEDDGEGPKIWSVDDCPRNHFQLNYLKGENPYAWFDQPVRKHTYSRKLMPHQCDLADNALTYHFEIWAAEMGVGKTLAAIEVMERGSAGSWWFVAPKAVLKAIERELKKWEYNGPPVTLMTYEALVSRVKTWTRDDEPPQGIVFDEASKLKGFASQRSQAAQIIADKIRAKYGTDGYVLLMSGTPSPKSPIDWWSLCEIAYPGFLREGSPKALQARLSWMEKASVEGAHFMKLTGWKDNPDKCATCGNFSDMCEGPSHKYKPSKNEIAFMYERLKGLVVVKLKKDCLNLPDKRFRKIYCTPSGSTLRVGQALVNTSMSAIVGATLLRELSDGFQYREVKHGTKPCTLCSKSGQVKEWFLPDDEDVTYQNIEAMDPEFVASLQTRMVDCPKCEGSGEMPNYVRETKEIPCPKYEVLSDLLGENEEVGRVLVFAGFEGSVDRCVKTAIADGWDVVRCDGRGFHVFNKDGEVKGVDALDYWADRTKERVAFIAHPESGGMGLTLVEARMAIFLSNSFKPEYRAQAMDRIHRPGMDENLGCEIVDIIHLPSDERVLQVLSENRTLELLTLGELTGVIDQKASE